MSLADAQQAFQAADDRWSNELRKSFGKRAGDARYTKSGVGDEGTALNKAYRDFHAARMEWERQVQEQRSKKGFGR